MAYKNISTLPFRRKRQGKTNYKKRLALLKSKTPRLVIRKSNKHMLIQLVTYGDKGDHVDFSVHSRQLVKYGWTLNPGNITAAYLTGLLLGVKSKGKKVILDLGLQSPGAGTRLYAALKGALDGGLKINVSEEVFPPEDRISGKHLSGNKVNEQFEKAKEKILGLK